MAVGVPVSGPSFRRGGAWADGSRSHHGGLAVVLVRPPQPPLRTAQFDSPVPDTASNIFPPPVCCTLQLRNQACDGVGESGEVEAILLLS